MSDRREVVLEATLRVIARSGVDAATHRAVAAEAGVALASTTYDFAHRWVPATADCGREVSIRWPDDEKRMNCC